MTTLEKPRRAIRSYVLRQGRITPSQKEALSTAWDHYGLEINAKIYQWDEVFARKAPRILEIGFGMGDSLFTLAQSHPENDYIGIEVHAPGVGSLLAKAQAHCLTNLKVFASDAVEVLVKSVKDNSLDKVLLLFPDPWPKKKHHKRRIVQSEFVQLVADKLKPNGFFHLATDWQPYADHMLAVLDSCPAFANAFGKGNFAPPGYERSLTKFEQRGQRLGHAICDLVFQSK